MTDKQINIVEILAEQFKNCTLYEGDTVSLNISIFDRHLKGVCFNNNIYFSVDELNYIMQKLISKEQECNQLKAENDELRMKNRILETECNEMRDVCNVFEQYYEHLMERHNKLKQTLTEIKEIVEQASEDYRMPEEEWNKILQKISECEGNDE